MITTTLILAAGFVINLFVAGGVSLAHDAVNNIPSNLTLLDTVAIQLNVIASALPL